MAVGLDFEDLVGWCGRGGGRGVDEVGREDEVGRVAAVEHSR